MSRDENAGVHPLGPSNRILSWAQRSWWAGLNIPYLISRYGVGIVEQIFLTLIPQIKDMNIVV
ncbi:hypothetical protein A3L04_02730 [Thermococcus chitonophagus]|uniref:Uncharacterized protein n=1 Tax=Thermococcus chitonophagus TaxID=54262 RepID=A0A2Z2NE35_9EURY|nr:hypothetical protein A3L04_02730 [Thermococcus chitonophagus]